MISGAIMNVRTPSEPRSVRFRWFGVAIICLLGVQAFAQLNSLAPDDVDRRVQSIIDKMTIEEKIDMLGGEDNMYTHALPRLGVPRLKMADGPLGVRNYGPSTAMAAGVSLAATWDPKLAERVGSEIARDARARGVNFMLAPAVNIYRAPMDGRNFEYFGEDPFLASRIAVAYIEGEQSQGVSSTIKHFLGNNSEFRRHDTDSVIDERTMREIYLPTFEAAVKEAHVGAVMDSYNLTNGLHMSQNALLNVGLLKGEWGFRGVLMSDWTSTYDGVAAANAGVDLEMPSGKFMNRQTLLPAIQQGKVSVATIDDKIRRILRTAVEFGWLDRDQTDLSVSRFNREGDQVALEGARESIVLLKNEGALLPLNRGRIKSIAVIGPDAYPPVPTGGGSARVQPFKAVSFLEGIANSVPPSVPVYYDSGVLSLSEMAEATNFSVAPQNGAVGLQAEYFANPDFQGIPYLARVEKNVNFGPPGKKTLPDQSLSARWTGYYVPQSAGDYDVFVASTGEDGGYYRAYVDGKLILDNWNSARELTGFATLSLDGNPHRIVLEHRGLSDWIGSRFRLGIVRHEDYVTANAKALAAKADVVVVAAGFDPETESEAADRTFRLPPGQDELIREMVAANKNTIVVLTSGGGVDMTRWLDSVPALLQAWYPGQEGGRALADILFGDANPSGRLPMTFERQWADNPVHDNYYPAPDTNRVVYREGVFVGYRGYERNGTKPLFPFGFGLSYTSFSYSNLAILSVEAPATDRDSSEPHVEVSFDVKNVGSRAGADVAEVYVGEAHPKVPRPAQELKGFARIELAPGETKRVTIRLDRRAFSYYNPDAKHWLAQPDEFNISVGRSVEAVELRGKLALAPSLANAFTNEK
jgi:beta-glucosidase